jgi:hypothetical protein
MCQHQHLRYKPVTSQTMALQSAAVQPHGMHNIAVHCCTLYSTCGTCLMVSAQHQQPGKQQMSTHWEL